MNREKKFRYAYSDGKGNGIVSPGFTLEAIRDDDKHPDLVFEDITECDCQPIGETNVVECNCEDKWTGYTHVSTDEWSGLSDSNDEEIYEGDILKLERTIFRYEVRFENGSFVCYHYGNDYGRWGNLSRIKDHDFSKYKINVIGNIYETAKI